jgi:hypothetical protein
LHDFINVLFFNDAFVSFLEKKKEEKKAKLIIFQKSFAIKVHFLKLHCLQNQKLKNKKVSKKMNIKTNVVCTLSTLRHLLLDVIYHCHEMYIHEGRDHC